LKIFFDNNLPPALAHALKALCGNDPHVSDVTHLRDRFAGDSKDLVWISSLAKEAGPWYVISIDKFKKDHRTEREAIKRAGLTVYVLDSHWSSQSYWSKAARFILWWPVISKHASLSSGGVYRVPWHFTNQARLQAC
jgi:hypothetical protein